MTYSSRNFKRLGNGFNISLLTDENGLTGRECPNPKCLGYFKYKLGTGLQGEDLPCHCPYCGHTASHDQFFTQEQNQYIKSIVEREFIQAFTAEVNGWNRDLQRISRNSMVKLSIEFKGQSTPIRNYREKELETFVICENCSLEYSIYGVFAFCPDCGTHNSLQILEKNFELIKKELGLANKQEDRDLAQRLIDDALENAVAVFDGFGRSICKAYSSKAINKNKVVNISFQNIENARKVVLENFEFDIANGLENTDWEKIIKNFQKRHLLAHKMGVVDQDYINKTEDYSIPVGRKIRIKPEEVSEFTDLLIIIGKTMFLQMSKPFVGQK